MLYIYTDGHTTKKKPRISVGYVIYQGGLHEPITSGRALFKINKTYKSNDGEIVSILFTLCDVIEKGLEGPAIVFNDNASVINTLNNSIFTEYDPAEIYTYSRNYLNAIRGFSNKLDVEKYVHKSSRNSSRITEAHNIANKMKRTKKITHELEALITKGLRLQNGTYIVVDGVIKYQK